MKVYFPTTVNYASTQHHSMRWCQKGPSWVIHHTCTILLTRIMWKCSELWTLMIGYDTYIFTFWWFFLGKGNIDTLWTTVHMQQVVFQLDVKFYSMIAVHLNQEPLKQWNHSPGSHFDCIIPTVSPSFAQRSKVQIIQYSHICLPISSGWHPLPSDSWVEWIWSIFKSNIYKRFWYVKMAFTFFHFLALEKLYSKLSFQ